MALSVSKGKIISFIDNSISYLTEKWSVCQRTVEEMKTTGFAMALDGVFWDGSAALAVSRHTCRRRIFWRIQMSKLQFFMAFTYL